MASGTLRPQELSLAVRTLCLSHKGVEVATASIRPATPLQSHRWRERAEWTGDPRAAGRKFCRGTEEGSYAIDGHRPNNGSSPGDILPTFRPWMPKAELHPETGKLPAGCCGL